MKCGDTCQYKTSACKTVLDSSQTENKLIKELEDGYFYGSHVRQSQNANERPDLTAENYLIKKFH